jgi:restriction endonuclease S subunit
VADIKRGKIITEVETTIGNVKVVSGGLNFAYYHNESNRPKNTITISASGANAGFVNIWKDEIYASDCTTVISNNKANQLYIYNVLKALQPNIFDLARGSAQPHVYPDDIKSLKIPLPPLNIQKDIVKECSLIDDDVEKANENIKANKLKIQTYFQDILSQANKSYRLSDETNFEAFIGRRIVQKDIDNQKSGLPIYSANVFDIFGYTSKEFLKDFNSPSILWGIDGDWMVNYMEKDKPFHPTDHCGVIRVKTDDINSKYLTWALLQEGTKVNFSRTHRASTQRVKALSIKAPSRNIQDTIIEKIQKLEIQINESKRILDSASDKKKDILKKYL